MDGFAEQAVSFDYESGHAYVERAASLLGGRRVLRRGVRNALEAHDLVVEGMPAKALDHLLDDLVALDRGHLLEGVLGMSLRTYQRHKENPGKSLGHEQSCRVWKFAEILAMAVEVFGSRDEAEQWLDRPAVGLEQRRPIDLLATPAGTEIVETFLTRLDYCVYA